MGPMIVRCGRCRSELEIPGPGEFVCPACGTRNVARGGAAPDPFSISGAAPSAGLTVPGGTLPLQQQQTPGPEANWAVCPSCAFRFAIGEVERVTCPNCRATLDRAPDGSVSVSAG